MNRTDVVDWTFAIGAPIVVVVVLWLLLAPLACAGTVHKCTIGGKLEFRDYPCDSVPMGYGVSSWEWQQGMATYSTPLPLPPAEPQVIRDPNADWNAHVTQRVRELNRPQVTYGAWDGGYRYRRGWR